ncbi:AraC family transcriptional regulator [Devosia sp. XJ19-1]|uniref:AraC family transcriptional regulator n=1 Tax=Devosia ureilytica TaxID=2952754 RepID=A0A9Q4ALF4_9HYPH|nr:AraC family transcriptional regulator [Devosia ureilytica]MCP8885783.1 AraC family transcriptional regulator [Devosia ureilytica]
MDSKNVGGALPPFVKLIRAGSLLALHCDASDPEVCGREPFAVPSFGLGDGYMLVVHLAPLTGADIWRNGRPLGRITGDVGSVQFFDLLHTWRAVITPPFNSVNIRLHRQLLDDIATEAGSPIDCLDLPRIEDPQVDPAIHAMAQALLPSFQRSTEMTTLFAERLISALAIHLVDNYRGPRRSAAGPAEGLAHWQQRRAADMILDNIRTDIALIDLAKACNLSPSHFAKAFRVSFGLPPHRWMTQERLRLAREAMLNGNSTLSDIAIASGFYDQSHLTRAFRSFMGMTPGAWRRMQGVASSRSGPRPDDT